MNAGAKAVLIVGLLFTVGGAIWWLMDMVNYGPVRLTIGGFILVVTGWIGKDVAKL